MPNFKIRRRRRKVDPPPPEPEEKMDEAEESVSMESEEMLIDKALEGLQVSKLNRQKSVPQYQPTKPAVQQRQPQVQHNLAQTRPQLQNHANVVNNRQKSASHMRHLHGRSHIPNQYTSRPTMAIQNPRSKLRRGGANMRFSSHYGAGGEHLDTRTKSVLLYNHCFG